jgi:hypothetical protein
MSNLAVNGVLLSKNRKTGLSINVSSCRPTPFCAMHCYARARSTSSIQRNGWTGKTTPNNGPITWDTQRAAYASNEARIKYLSGKGELEATAVGIVQVMERLGMTHLRGNGVGDLFPELCELYAYIGAHGKTVFLFSRIPQMIHELGELYKVLGGNKPYVLGSVDPSTSLTDTGELSWATEYTNGSPALAYATAAVARKELDAELSRLGFYREEVRVIFGYHTNHLHTVVSHPLACPATNGEDIVCSSCRRCYGS